MVGGSAEGVPGGDLGEFRVSESLREFQRLCPWSVPSEGSARPLRGGAGRAATRKISQAARSFWWWFYCADFLPQSQPPPVLTPLPSPPDGGPTLFDGAWFGARFYGAWFCPPP